MANWIGISHHNFAMREGGCFALETAFTLFSHLFLFPPYRLTWDVIFEQILLMVSCDLFSHLQSLGQPDRRGYHGPGRYQPVFPANHVSTSHVFLSSPTRFPQ